MGYYDEVKKNVREEASDGSSSEKSEPSFSKLKEAAQDTDPEDEGGDDTEIEVVGKDPIESHNSENSRTKDQRTPNQKERKERRSDFSSGKGNEELAEKLDKIIEQNQRMIDILESFGS